MNKEVKNEEDPIAEIRRIRDAHAKKFNYDLRAIFDDFKRFEDEQKLKTVSLPSKRIEKTGS